MPEIPTFSEKANLQAALGEVLTKGPLYRTFVYRQNGVHEETIQGSRFCRLPAEVEMFCGHEKCNKEQHWQAQNTTFYFANRFIMEAVYTCRNCGGKQAHYYFIWQEHPNGENIFLKIGQYPELEERISDALVKALDKDDLKLYKNALRLRNFNLGLAAVAYMRRVVENKMNDILDVLRDAAVAHNAPADLLAHHEEMKKEKRFTTKVEYAGALVPSSLRPEGMPNPMAILHELASEGLHAKSDDECINIFDNCRLTFEYVFGRLRIETEEAKGFLKSLAGLLEARAKFAKAAESKPAKGE